jgi:hypothetical protein
LIGKLTLAFNALKDKHRSGRWLIVFDVMRKIIIFKFGFFWTFGRFFNAVVKCRIGYHFE